ncbi:hypothetical protein JD844_000501 [Phrynosoma platyrhinos]|uniref:Uncharacterized protein n=1 Tax=Phrynosoma platyrhinos TaxID=52577 RepID=A0ABQ7SQP4_PHRPL|nr:hypothetical protein JD844_000501 [Phrynosoma platyrhinos]
MAGCLMDLRKFYKPKLAAPLRMEMNPYTVQQDMNATSSTLAMLLRASPIGASASSYVELLMGGIYGLNIIRNTLEAVPIMWWVM